MSYILPSSPCLHLVLGFVNLSLQQSATALCKNEFARTSCGKGKQKGNQKGITTHIANRNKNNITPERTYIVFVFVLQKARLRGRV